MPTVVRAPPHASANHTTLDIPERQLLEFFAGDQFQGHHRVLNASLGNGRWIVTSPTLDTYATDFSGAGVVPLTRNCPFPLQDRPYFTFDHLDMATLQRMRATAAALLAVMGGTPQPPPKAAGAEWFYADPAHERFSEAVEDYVLTADSTVVRGCSALVVDTAEAEESWTVLEHVTEKYKEEWFSDKREGAGRDPRLLPLPALPEGRGYTVREAHAKASAIAAKFRCFKGPSAALELLTALVASGLEPAAYCAQFEAASGLPAKSALAHELRVLFHALALLIGVDRIDPHQSAAAEHLCRRILQVQKAVRRNPKAPDFEGLEAYMAHAADPSLALAASSFEAHIGDVLKAESAILKQSRLAKEEWSAVAKAKAKAGS